MRLLDFLIVELLNEKRLLTPNQRLLKNACYYRQNAHSTVICMFKRKVSCKKTQLKNIPSKSFFERNKKAGCI